MSKPFAYAILDWARSKPADERYSYLDRCDCAIGQFLKETGRAHKPLVLGDTWQERDGGAVHSFDARVDAAANDDDETMGGFAKRLESALS